VALEQFLLLGFHDRKVKDRKEDSERQQQPIALSGYDDSQSHEEGAEVKGISGQGIGPSLREDSPLFNMPRCP